MKMNPTAENPAGTTDNPLALEQSAAFYARRARIAKNRAVPTTRRQAFLQRVGIAIADELELRRDVDTRIEAEQVAADTAQQQAEQTAADAAFAAKHPIEAAFDQAHGYRMGYAPFGRSSQEPRILRWATEQGILLQDTTQMPATDEQYLLLACWQPTE